MDRIVIDVGNPFLFRVSKQGKSVWSGDYNDFVMHEQLGTIAPYVTGVVNVAAKSNTHISLGRVYSAPALIMLKPSGGVVPYITQFEAKMQADMASVRIYNYTNTTRDVRYYLYWNSIGG